MMNNRQEHPSRNIFSSFDNTDSSAEKIRALTQLLDDKNTPFTIQMDARKVIQAIIQSS